MTSRIRRLARDTAIVVAVTLVLLVLLEGGVRLLAPQSLTGTSLRGEHFSAVDSVLGLSYVPNAIWRFRHPEYEVEYAINRDGFRDARQRPARKPPGVTRVLLLGDSFTFGQGVNYDEAWPVVAERELERRFPGRLDLVKAGLQGMDTRSELILLRRLAPALEIDAVVLGFLINDVYTNVALEPSDLDDAAGGVAAWDTVRNTIFRPANETPSFHLLTLARRLVTSIDAAYIGLYLSVPERGDFLRRPLPARAEEKLRVTEELLEQMASYCDSLGVPFVVLSIPQQFQVLYLREPRADPSIDVHLYDRRLAELAAERGFTWVTTLQALQRADTGKVELFHRLDGHLTARGNSIVALEFVDQVAPRLLPSP